MNQRVIPSYLPPLRRTLPVTGQDELTGKPRTLKFKITGYDTGEGARGILARATLNLGDKSKTQVIVKFPNLDEHMSPIDIEERLADFRGDVTRELNAWDRLRSGAAKPHIATIYGTGEDTARIGDDLYTIPYLVQEYVDGLQLDKWCEREYRSIPFKGIKSAAKWFSLSRRLVEVLGLIHQERVVHGDIWQPNIMMRNSDGEPVFVDFGQARPLEWMRGVRKDSTLYPYYAPERKKDSEIEGPWYQPADIYAICGILSYLATGCHPPPTYNDDVKLGRLGPISKSQTKKEIVEAIKEINPKLYWANLGIPDIIVYGLRPKAHERATHVDALLEVMDYYRDAFRRNSNKPRVVRPGESEDLCDLLQDFCLKFGDDEIHERILKRILSYVRVQVDSLYSNRPPSDRQKSQLYNLRGGDRDELVKYLLAAFSGLRAGDQILAQTTPIFWRKQNFGANGRLLTMLKMAAIHGIAIRWVLLIEKDKQWKERDDEEGLGRILASQRAAVEELSVRGKIDVNSKSMDDLGFYFGYHLITEGERKEIVSTGQTFIVINERDARGGDNRTAILPTYTERNGHIASVRLWKNPNQWQHYWQKSLKENLKASTNILEYYPRTGVPEATI